MVTGLEHLERAKTFGELLEAAERVGLVQELRSPALGILEHLGDVRGWLVDSAADLLSSFSGEPLARFLREADLALAGREQRVLRKAVFAAARRTLTAAGGSKLRAPLRPLAATASPRPEPKATPAPAPAHPGAPSDTPKHAPPDAAPAHERPPAVAHSRVRPSPRRDQRDPSAACDPDALFEELSRAGVAHLLDKSVYAALRPRFPKLFTGSVNPDVERSSLGDLLTEDLWVDHSTGLPHKNLVALRLAAWSLIDELAARHADALKLEREILSSPLPPEPALRVVTERLRAIHGTLRKTLPPTAPGLMDTYEYSIVDDVPLELRGQEAANLPHGRPPATATVTLDARPEHAVALSCTCGHSGCEHMVAVVGHGLRLLSPANTHPARSKLVASLSLPEWQRALATMDAVLSASAPARSAPVQVSWMVGNNDGVLAISPFVRREGKRGLLEPKKVSAASLTEELGRRLGPRDREIAELVELAELAARAGSTTRPQLLLRALRRLIGQSNVIGVDGEPLLVEEGRLELIARAEGGEIRLIPWLSGRERRAQDLDDALSRGGIGDTIVELELAERRCRITRLEKDALDVVSALRRFDVRIPTSEREALVRRLPALEERIPIRFEGDLARRQVEAERKIVVRLYPSGATALSVRVFVRPIASGPLYVPGEGSFDAVAATSDRELVFARRDLDAEPAWVRERLTGLIPGVDEHTRTWTFEVDDGERALDLLARLRSASDLVVEWPSSDAWTISAPASPGHLRLAITDRGDWFGLAGGVEIDGHQVKLALLLDAVRGKKRFIPIEGGAWVELGETLTKRLAAVEPFLYSGRSGPEITPFAWPELERLVPEIAKLETSRAWRELGERRRRAQSFEPTIPEGLQADLRPYQREGHAWLSRLAAWGMGAVLADDMGLGKTVQTIGVLVDRGGGGPALVVAPTSVTYNWERELARFAPSLRPIPYRGPGRTELLSGLGPRDVVITSYALAARDTQQLGAHVFETLVLDEAQAIKNASSLRAQAIRTIRAKWTVALSGTPFENHLGELWSIFRVVSPGLLGSWESFRDRFAAPIERGRDQARAELLARALRPFVLRRTKAEVARDLPPRSEIRVDVELSAPEREIYEDARLAAIAKLANVTVQGAADEGRFMVLAAITRLRQLACHPRLIDESLNLASSKLTRLLELLRALIAEGQRALVFSQFTKHLALVRAALDAEGVAYVYLDGSTPGSERGARVDEFQSGTAPVFLISLKAGGTGLNLTAADNVFHLDPWWNPAAEDQATDRAHRIGQTRPVTVYRLVTRGTIEEAILTLQAEKRELVARVLEGTGAAAAISTEELLALIREGVGMSPSEAEDPLAGDEDPAPERQRVKLELEDERVHHGLG